MTTPWWLVSVLLFGFSTVANAGLEPGEITIAEMNCVACHEASPALEQRLASKTSPLLGPNGSQLSPKWVRDFLLNPQQEKPGNLMPDLLHGLSKEEKIEAADSLAHYLASQQSANTNAGTRLDPAVVKEGKELFHKVGCVACHAPQELPVVSSTALLEETFAGSSSQAGLVALATNSVPLGKLAKKYTVEALASFLRDPLRTRPAGRMPNLRLSENEAEAIAMYLLREQPIMVPSIKIPGLNYEHFVGVRMQLPDFTKLSVVTTGYTTNLSVIGVPHTNTTGLRFRAVLTVLQEGDYTFWTESRDGSQLFIDNQLVVDNDGVHKPTEKEGKIKLARGDHSMVTTYFHHIGPPTLKVSWSGPGISKQEIPGNSISLADNGEFMQYAEQPPFTLDKAKATRGAILFAHYNCASCHAMKQSGRKASRLDKLAGSNQGCLSPTPPAMAPAFAFTPDQRREISRLLSNLPVLEQPLSASEQVRRTMTALNCYACHGRDGQGSVPALRRAYFKANGMVDLGEEGSLPPHLDGVGAKLKPQWLKNVLLNGASVRPYMATRMPQFGEANVKSLVAALLQADAGQSGTHELVVDSNYVNGLRLVGSEGLNCIVCHTFAGHPGLGVPALDLTTAPERLNAEWFWRYLLDPAKLRAGTRMPSFWPEGVAANKAILNGGTEKQISAIWSYLSSAEAATNLPPGLIAPKMELAPKTEPLIYRNFIQDAGSRGIGVGYPEKVNLAFDANQMCVALLWHGQFMDASRHWTGRGGGWEPPLGYSVVKLAPGAPFAVLSGSSTPWPKVADRATDFQFRGYTYDTQRRPQFRYQFGTIEVTDMFLPAKIYTAAETGFHRSLTLASARPMTNLWFRAALAEKLDDLGDATYRLDNNVRLAFPSLSRADKAGNGAPATPIMRRSNDGKVELLVPVVFESGHAEIVEDISW